MKKHFTLLVFLLAFVSNAQSVSISSSATGAVCAGNNVTFTATPSGYTTPSYQWYKNNVAISGATSSIYSSSSLSNNDVIKVAVVEGNATVASSNLVMNLDAGNSASYTSGTTWTDLTGRGNNGTISSGITFNAANGGYFQFPNTGSNGVVLPASSNDFNFTTGDFAVELWVNAYNNQARLISLNSKSDFSSNALIIYPVADTPNSIYAGSLSSTGFIWYVWHHVVYTRISGTVSLYIDGVLKSTATNTSSLPSNSATTSNTLGSFIATNGYLSYTGKMSIARIYKASGLSSPQVVSNYNAICSRYGLSPIGTTSNSITTTVTPGLSVPSITVLGDACINKTTLSTTSGLSSYAWYKDNVAISGATINTYVPTEAGEYKVVVSNGTCSSTSVTTTISVCGVTADGSMSPMLTSSTLVNTEGAVNNANGIDERGLILKKPWIYGTITSPTGRVWIDRNLGATRVALNSTDALAYGDYFQWGRPADGHQTKYNTNNNSTGVTNTISTTSVPSTSLWIQPTDGSNDWLNMPNNSLWAGSNPANNPCPAGFRIPTIAEWQLEQAAFSSNNANGAFTSVLKLTMPGWLNSFDSSGASFFAKDTGGFYLTQSASSGGQVNYFGINSGNVWTDWNLNKSMGLSCRCIKD